MTFERALTVCALLLSCAITVHAADPWEADSEDDGPATRAHLLAGQAQTGRDLETATTPDEDWVFVATRPRHSYEARANGGSIWATGVSGTGAKLERLNSSLVVQQTGTDDGLASLRGNAIRWIAGNAQATDYLRVTGPTGPQGTSPYTLELFDTTYAVPRWNNSSTQVTVFLLQNNTSTPVSSFVYFFGASGTLLHTEPIGIAADGLAVFNTSTVPALAGQSGSARIAQTGGLGALSGKAVSLEPGTGFTFDTALIPVMP
jgi:hypothetical protein